MQDFTTEEKALMFDNVIDMIVNGYEKPRAKDFPYKSVAEMVGYEILISLNDNGFITSEGILGK